MILYSFVTAEGLCTGTKNPRRTLAHLKNLFMGYGLLSDVELVGLHKLINDLETDWGNCLDNDEPVLARDVERVIEEAHRARKLGAEYVGFE